MKKDYLVLAGVVLLLAVGFFLVTGLGDSDGDAGVDSTLERISAAGGEYGVYDDPDPEPDPGCFGSQD